MATAASKSRWTSSDPPPSQSRACRIRETFSNGEFLFLSSFRTYKNVANYVARGGYRPDLRHAAIARASAVFKSQRPVKAEPEKKLRGNAAKKAAASE